MTPGASAGRSARATFRFHAGRRWAIRLAGSAAVAVLLVEALEIALWPLPFGSLYLLAVLSVVGVPLAGAWLLIRGDERGVAVLGAGALIALPTLTFDVTQLIWWTDPITAIELLLAVLRVAGSAALFASGIVAWRFRRRDRWSWTAPVPWAYAIIATVTFVIGHLWPTRWFFPPRTIADLAPLLQVVVFATVLIVVARLSRSLGSAALLAAVAPVLATSLFDVGQMLSFGATLGDLSGLVDVTGRAILVGIAIHWWRIERPQGIAAPEPT